MKAPQEGSPSDGLASAPAGASDAELLHAIAGGSEPAFDELRRRYGPAVARVCRSVGGADREDCEQEVFARIWRKAALFDPERGTAAAWLLTVTRRTALNVRAAGGRPVSIGEVPEPAVDPPEIDAFWLDGALGRLPERERTVIELAYYSDLTDVAIARRLHVPLGSVKSWKRRGLNRLASLLAEESS
jgi:RNA polymerase sigma-70 factor (ECF subfamily)